MAMQAKLDAYRKGKGKQTVPEHDLLQDVLFVLQGIDGQYVTFTSSHAKQATSGLIHIAKQNGSVPQPTQDLLIRLAELGVLFKRIHAALALSRGPSSSHIGMIEQSLHHAIQNELASYYRLVAVLESRLSKEDALLKPLPAEPAVPDALPVDLTGDVGLTLRRLQVWTEDTRLRMRLMAVLVDGCAKAQGGALLSLIHTYTSHGDPFIRSFTDKLLNQVSKPFFDTLAKWIHDGELDDPFHEFFVDLNRDLKSIQFANLASSRRGNELISQAADGRSDHFGLADLDSNGIDAHQLWKDKFGFRIEMLPSFVSEQFGRKIFSTGKSLNFIKYSCHDSDWIVTRNKLSTDHANKVLQYSDIAGLEQSIDVAYNIASQRLFDIFLDKFRLIDNLVAIKDYLMLGKGDFIELLMESLGTSLDRPANTLYRHHLTACLETAIRGSTSAHENADVLRRLDARMADSEEDEEEKTGWQSFMLEFKIDRPLDTILDPDVMVKYGRIFSQLWMTKRVELTLSAAWHRIVTQSRLYAKVQDLQGSFHKARLALSEMVHFVRQLQYFYFSEVISCAWQDLETFLNKKQGDLDSLIQAHASYLDRLVKKCLLLIPSKSGKEEFLLLQVRTVFESILAYCNAVEALSNYALSEANRLDTLMDEARGLPVQRLPEPDPEMTETIRKRLQRASTSFQEVTLNVISVLATHQDMDLRFLSVRLNFSLHYVIGKQRKAK